MQKYKKYVKCNAYYNIWDMNQVSKFRSFNSVYRDMNLHKRPHFNYKNIKFLNSLSDFDFR